MMGDCLVCWNAVAQGIDGELKKNPTQSWGSLLQAVQQGFEQLPHGRKGIGIEQRSHPLPPQAFAAELCPYRLKQRTTELLGLIHQKREHHQHGKHHREILLAMPVVVLKVLALVFQRIEGFVFDLPPGSSPSHETKDVARVTRKSVTQLKCWTLS